MAEYELMKKTKPSGVYVVPSARSSLVWNGVVFVRQGIYRDAIFRFSINIPDNFPDGDSPSVVFKPPVFHPLIDSETGQLDVRRSFEKWRRNYNHLWQVVHYIYKIFYKIETASSSNCEAAELYEEDMETYKQRVSETIANAKSVLYNDPDVSDTHAIRFTRAESDQLSEKKSHVFSQTNQSQSDEGVRTIESLGMSWMKSGTYDIFVTDQLNSK